MSNGEGIRKSRTCTPEALWREIEREAGPLDQIDYDGLKRALDLALVEAIGENVVSVPQIVAERMLADFLAQQRGEPLRPKHRPRKSWWMRRWEETACRQFEHRRRELMRGGHSRDQANKQAAAEIAPGYSVTPSTIIDWAAHPGRRRK
jgi:hypothetical protein